MNSHVRFAAVQHKMYIDSGCRLQELVNYAKKPDKSRPEFWKIVTASCRKDLTLRICVPLATGQTCAIPLIFDDICHKTKTCVLENLIRRLVCDIFSMRSIHARV